MASENKPETLILLIICHSFKIKTMTTIDDFKYHQRVKMRDPDTGGIVHGTVTNISYTDNEVTIQWDDLFHECEHDESEFALIKPV